jgi:transposase
MIGLAPETRVWLASGPTDMRRGFDGLALLVQETLRREGIDWRLPQHTRRPQAAG